MEWRPDQDAWLSGFADGEAHFSVVANKARLGERPYAGPRFSIALRADDVGILRRLVATFGGHVSFELTAGNPQCRWRVSAKADLLNLAAYFDRFPLRAKKARDFALWREAVRLYVKRRGGGDAYAELVAIRDALKAGRGYNAEAADRPEVAEPQLRLVEDGRS